MVLRDMMQQCRNTHAFALVQKSVCITGTQDHEDGEICESKLRESE